MEKINKKKVLVFLDVSIDGDPLERMVFELFPDVAPKTVENFRALCTGDKGVSPKTGKPLHYKGTFFHSIIKGYMAQGGDFLRKDGKYGESIYGENFPDESPKLKHDSVGLLSMSLADRDVRGSLFSITFKADRYLDRTNIAFGKLVEGHDVLKKIEEAGDEEGRPTVTVKIVNSGELLDDKKKGNSLKTGKGSLDENNNEVKRMGEHKKSSKKTRKRKRYYTSESDTTPDSSESLLSDTSSSSDYRRKRRKKQKREKHRRGKKKDKRHEKQRWRRDRESKRHSDTDSESDTKSESSSHNNGAFDALDGKHRTSGNTSSVVKEQEIAKINHKKVEAADIFERGGEFPKENGDHRRNYNAGARIDSDGSADRHRNVVGDHPSKSRSQSMSPRSPDRSTGVNAKHNRSLHASPSPQEISGQSLSRIRSQSNMPFRSGSSRSPPMGRRDRSVDMSPPPARCLSPRSRSATASPPRRSRNRSATASPPRRVSQSPPIGSSSRSSLRSASRSPVRSSRRSLSRSSGKPPRRSVSKSPVRSARRTVSRSSGRVSPRRRSLSPNPIRAPRRANRLNYSGSPASAGRRARSPIPDRGKSFSRSPSVDGSSKRIRRGRGFSDRYDFVRQYRSRSRSPNRSPIRSYRYDGRGDRYRYPSYRRSPRRYRSPPRGRSPRFRGRRSRSRTASASRSPIRYRTRRCSPSQSPVRSRSPTRRSNCSPPRAVRRRSPARSASPSASQSSLDSQSPKRVRKGNSRSSSGSSPRKGGPGLVSYGDGSADSGRD